MDAQELAELKEQIAEVEAGAGANWYSPINWSKVGPELIAQAERGLKADALAEALDEIAYIPAINAADKPWRRVARAALAIWGTWAPETKPPTTEDVPFRI